MTKPLAAQIEVAPVNRVFARLQRLLGDYLAARDIELTASVDPETLELAPDADPLDQALINLVHNTVEALRATAAARIGLSARRDPDSQLIAVGDNGPGIPLSSATRSSCPSSQPSGTGAASDSR